MIYPFQSLLRVNKAWLADSERVVKDRQPGAFKRIVNVVPNLSDGIGQLRTGYQVYNSTNGGINFNSGDGFSTEVPFVLPVQSPTDADVYLLCQKDGSSNKRIKMYPHWTANGSSSPFAELLTINYSFRTGNAAGEFTLNADAKKIDFDAANVISGGLSTVNDYYNGWLVYNEDRTKYALVTDYAVSAGAATVTFLEDVHGGTSLGFVAGDKLTWIANFHDSPYEATVFPTGFSPTYNDDKANPPTANAQNSIVRFSGGQGNTYGLRGIHITPRLTRTFFPDHARTYTYNKTYISERECKTFSGSLAVGVPVSVESGGGNTENLTPLGALGDVGSFTVTGSSFIDAIADGATPNDADFVTIQFGATNKYLQLYLPPTTETPDPSGSTTITVRYKCTEDFAGIGYIEFGLWDATGEKSTYTIAETATVGAFKEVTLDTPNAGLDTSSLVVHMRFASTGLYTFDISNVNVVADTMTFANYLDTGKTYWVGVSAIYDGFQISRPFEADDPTDYGFVSGGWTSNYLATAPGVLRCNFQINPATLNKRITGFAIYLAIDEGQTTTRKAQFQYVKSVSITQTDKYSTTWTYDGASGLFTQSVYIDGADVTAIGNVFITDAGYDDRDADVGYAYSTEEIISGRRLMANVYVQSESLIDRSFVFTNPTGQNPDINAGVVQPDIFPNEEGAFRLKVNPLIGTKINAIVATGIDEFLVLKDRGAVACRLVIPEDTPDIIQEVVSHDVGCSCVNSFAKDDAGILYFAGYDDVYAYKNGQLQPLVERDDKNDWLYTYRSTLTRTQKESTTIFYLPELKSLMFLFGVEKAGSNYAQLQYLFHRGLWSEVALNDDTDFNGTPNLSMRWVTQLRSGHVLCTSTEPTPGFYRMSWATSNGGTTFALTYTDNGVGIVPYFDTGDLLMGDESTDVVLNKFVVNRTFTSQTLAGSLDLSVYNERGVGYLKTGISTSDTRITARLAPTVARKGQSWRAIYNRAGSGRERITAGQYQINSLEFFGKKLPRVRSTGK